MIGRDGSPFDCEKCSDRDKELRNCFNRLGLSDAARAVTEYTGAVIEELENPLQGVKPPVINPPLPPFSEGGSEDSPSGGSKEIPPKGSCDLAKGESSRSVAQSAQKVFSLGDIRLYECPVSYISYETVEMMRLVYLIDDSGSLLHGGGWGDQPAWLIEAVEVFRTERISSLKAQKDSNALIG